MPKPRQLNNSAATWLNTHKDALLPTYDALNDLPYSDYSDEEDYVVKVWNNVED
jgi:hypothetical protein